MFKIIVVCICCLLTGCTFFGGKHAVNEQQLYYRINEAYDFEVTHCDSFAMARGRGTNEFALRDAKNQAMKYGEEIGGTHIVWIHVDEGEVTKVVAVVYKCLQ
ncbi:hypothetical protein L2755_16965 [Shewanella abyssi]|uniref:hypothetical protein n=1 Tax=Shewanella abyssi TaxID=311789 RepID=UPI00200D5BC4|nr:hypothetical protein [Shewanella abyssi]